MKLDDMDECTKRTEAHACIHSESGLSFSPITSSLMVFLPVQYNVSESVIFSDNDPTNHRAQGEKSDYKSGIRSSIALYVTM